VGVERNLDADDARKHRHRGAAQHRPGAGACVIPHGQRRSDQHREHEQGPESLDRHGHRGREQDEQDEAHHGGAQARRRGTGGVEGHGRERPVERDERRSAQHKQGCRGGQVAVGHAERVAEQQLLQSLRRLRRQREQRSEPNQTGHSHGGARVRADARVARGERDQRSRHERPARRAQ